jgi:hypothetical protein
MKGNPNTRVVVFAYAGDAHQVQTLLPYYLHHGCPVTVFSPADAPIESLELPEGADVTFRTGGKKCYVGVDGIARQKIHMQMMLEFPEQYFFAADADSLCLDPLLPAYLYKEPDVLWSNEIPDLMHERAPGHLLPRIALHPPWFFSRATIKRLLSVDAFITPDPVTPVIDHWLLQAASFALVTHRDFVNGATSFPTENDEFHFGVLSGKVRYAGTVFVHTVKSKRVLNRLLEDRKFYLRNL